MSVILSVRRTKPANDNLMQRGFWRRLGRAIDALAAYPVKHALSEQELRRVDGDIVRCRKLMFPQRQRSSAVVPLRSSVNRAVRTRAIKLRP
jgi:hypothetical protein